MRDYIHFAVNGTPYRIHGADVFLSLSDFLRKRLRLVGTKIVCSEGDCGACSVLVGREREGRFHYQTVDACIQFVFQLDGSHIISVEGLKRDGGLNAVQEAMVACHGSQCGFCTPGFVVAMTELRSARDSLSECDLRRGLAGNLCRCTGYAPILEAGLRVNGAARDSIENLFDGDALVRVLRETATDSIRIDAKHNGVFRTVCSPRDLKNATEFLAAHPDATIVAGGTDIGVQTNKRTIELDCVLDLNRVAELTGARIENGALIAGGRATWTEIRDAVADAAPELHKILDVFGAPQIRNVGTIGGNIANASPIADSLPFLFVCEATLILLGAGGRREVNINDFYHGYKKFDLKPGELIAEIRVPLPSEDEVIRLYRVAKRRDLDIAGFTAAIKVRVNGGVILESAIALGAVGPTVSRARATERFLIGEQLSEEMMIAAGDIAVSEIAPISDVRGSADYRRHLTRNVLIKFFHDTNANTAAAPSRLAARPSRFTVALAERDGRDIKSSPALSVGEPIPHESGAGHVAGAAPYLDDLPLVENELFVSFAGAPVASGEITNVDRTKALAIDGVVGVWLASDIPGQNLFGPIVEDEPFLIDRTIDYVGQPVAVIAAESLEAAERARKLVRIDATPRDAIFSIDDAIANDSFLGDESRIHRGHLPAAFDSAPHVLSGTFHSGGQEQFYLESQAAIAYPGESGQMTIHSSTQNPTEIQAVVAAMLGLGQHEVVCLCKRMGGAFGGKETQAAIPALMAALASRHTGRPARVIYNKDDDMKVTGKRHPYRTDWRVGFDDDGRILAYDVRFFSDGGASTDLSPAVMQRSMLHAENAYFIPNIDIRGRVCRTNKPPNTAFRGFGGPQAIAAMENVMEEIAAHLDVDALEVRRRNLYGREERDVTPYGQGFKNNHLPEIFASLAERANYASRRDDIERFNAASRVLLRGISMTAVKFGISFTNQSLNQASALVNVYTDGTVQVSTGGTEMGQGLNTKIRQVVADEFAIPPDRVLVMPASTEKNNNASATAASAGMDLNGLAAVDACRKIKVNFATCFSKSNASKNGVTNGAADDVVFEDGFVFHRRAPQEKLTFAEAAARAQRERVSIGARGFYATPGLNFDRETGTGEPFFYYTQGAAVSEVEIDRFTGELRAPRVDLLIDIGKSINPGVDMGQITGGFIQGMGWVTMEQLCYDEQGNLLSHSPTTYKIPAISDTPETFNCDLFDSDDNILNIRRSKAVGEPPLMLGISVWTAAKHALSAVSKDAACDLRLPATGEEIVRLLANSRRRAASATLPQKN